MRPWVVATLLMGAVVSAAAADPDFIQARSWQFIAERGGLSVGNPVEVRGGYRLPVTCNVSGIETVTTRPAVIHTHLAWWRSAVHIEGRLIELTVLTAEQGPNAPSAECGPADLGYIDPGTWHVVYRDPDGTTHLLRDIVVP